MQLSPDEREEKIRPLATAGISTRDIERMTGIPQSTVVRDLKRINTGPLPVIRPDTGKAPKSLQRWAWPIGISATALLVLAVVLGAMTLMRAVQAPQAAYTPVFPAKVAAQPAADTYLCIGITMEGYVSDIAPATQHKCPEDWKLLVLHPGG